MLVMVLMMASAALAGFPADGKPSDVPNKGDAQITDVGNGNMPEDAKNAMGNGMNGTMDKDRNRSMEKVHFPLDEDANFSQPGMKGIHNAMQNVKNERARERLQQVMNNLSAMAQNRLAEMDNVQFQQQNDSDDENFVARGTKKAGLFGTAAFQRDVNVEYIVDDKGGILKKQDRRNAVMQFLFPAE